MTLIRNAMTMVLLAAALPVLADTVDNFSVPMGPITVGPGEEPTEEEATMFAAGVLGGFRVLAPVVDEEAPASDRATTSIAGGVFECDLTATSYGGGCTVGWPGDEEGDSFDFTQAGAVEFEILEAAAGAIVAVILIDGSVSTSDVISGEARRPTAPWRSWRTRGRASTRCPSRSSSTSRTPPRPLISPP